MFLGILELYGCYCDWGDNSGFASIFFFFFFWVSFLDRLLSMSGFNAGISGFCTFEQTSAQHMRLEYHHIYLSHLR